MAAGASAFGSVTRATSSACRAMRSSSRVSNGRAPIALAEGGAQRRVVVGRRQRPAALRIRVVQGDDLELVGEALERLDPARDVVLGEADDTDAQAVSRCRHVIVIAAA